MYVLWLFHFTRFLACASMILTFSRVFTENRAYCNWGGWHLVARPLAAMPLSSLLFDPISPQRTRCRILFSIPQFRFVIEWYLGTSWAFPCPCQTIIKFINTSSLLGVAAFLPFLIVPCILWSRTSTRILAFQPYERKCQEERSPDR